MEFGEYIFIRRLLYIYSIYIAWESMLLPGPGGPAKIFKMF